jgi:recombination protein RecA
VTSQPTSPAAPTDITVAPPTTSTASKEDRFKALQAVEKALNKQFNTTSSLVRLGAKVGVPMPHYSTNIPSLDYGVFEIGGVPKGRIIEIFGPESAGKTTATLEIISAVQGAGGIAAFVDAEHALDPNYAKKLGVNVDELFVSQPDSGEQALETVEALVKSRAVDIVVVDSVAALVPQAELDGEMGDSHMGLQARLMSQAMRKLRGICNLTGITVIFINQIREKIGVMFGCFSYNTRVMLADGSSEKIGKIVNQKIGVNVLSVDPETGKVSSKPITDWHQNGNTDEFLRIETTNGLGRSGRSSMAVTPGHIILTPNGDSKAGDLKVGDKVWGLGKLTYSEHQFKVAVGSVLGDGNLRPTGAHNISLRIRHGHKQKEYAQYKALIFGNMLADSGTDKNGSWGFDVAPSSDLSNLYRECYIEKGRRAIGQGIIDNLCLESVAIWYMDDGTFSGSYKKWGKGKSCISAKAYTEGELELLASALERLGLPKPNVNSCKQLYWYGDDSYALQSALAPHIHPSMGYKIHPELRGRFKGLPKESDLYIPSVKTLVETFVSKVEPAKRTRSMRRFDITVGGNHTYFVDGIAVHNSPETTTGGRALKFYASVRLDVRRVSKTDGGEITSGGVLIGHKMRMKAVKNKVGTPFQDTVVNVIYGKGIDRFADLISYAVEVGALTKGGGGYISYNGEKIAQGVDNAVNVLRDKPELVAKIRADVAKAVKAHAEEAAQ